MGKVQVALLFIAEAVIALIAVRGICVGSSVTMAIVAGVVVLNLKVKKSIKKSRIAPKHKTITESYKLTEAQPEEQLPQEEVKETPGIE